MVDDVASASESVLREVLACGGRKRRGEAKKKLISQKHRKKKTRNLDLNLDNYLKETEDGITRVKTDFRQDGLSSSSGGSN